eukprot:TRINITY_DN15562_c0_g1_i9.p1 TRINITY_DN15562_c0_g1~~TRINITY_DN15562_c0_g1_i9.p1  ORF type:complete len:137 (-),score=18.79 TRINITY_DN15562_c0_g1_i9:23-433(-)
MAGPMRCRALRRSSVRTEPAISPGRRLRSMAAGRAGCSDAHGERGMTLEEMLAREAIRYTIELYNRASDTADYDLHHQVFHPDGLFEVQGQGALQGPDAIIAMLLPAARRRGAFDPEIGRAVQQECRDRSRMPSSA